MIKRTICIEKNLPRKASLEAKPSLNRTNISIKKMKSKQQEQSKKDNLASEPSVVYGKRRITTFTSFEEMNEAEAKEMANISPIFHLQNATMLIRKVYAEQLKQPMNKTLTM